MTRLSLVTLMVVAALCTSHAGEISADPVFTGLGLDSRKPIERNLEVLADPGELVVGTWVGSSGPFRVLLSGRLAAAPDVISVSTELKYTQKAMETTFGLDAADAMPSSCPRELLMDDGIGCGAVMYGCIEKARRCHVMLTTYIRNGLPEYSPFYEIAVTWSSTGFELPAPSAALQ